MHPGDIRTLFEKEGYRFLKGRPEEITVYYKYYQEGFHVVIAVDCARGYELSPEQYHVVAERMTGQFYHPTEWLADFPDGFPVYHVEVLGLIIGREDGYVRDMCARCSCMWGYLPKDGRLFVYENQPGDFYGLRRAFDRLQSGCETWDTGSNGFAGKNAANSIKSFWRDRIKDGRNQPFVTLGFMAVNIIVYLIMEFIGDTRDGQFVAGHGGMFPAFLLYDHQWWRLITAGFIHFGAAHLVNNMVLLYCMGSRLERTVGHIRLFFIYVLSLLGASLLSFAMMLYTGNYAVSAGASGAVFGLIGGFLWALLLHRGRLEGITTRRMIFMVVLMIYYGISSGGTDNWGHIGGLLTGFLAAVILYHRKCQIC